jgi:hypothetical protein
MVWNILEILNQSMKSLWLSNQAHVYARFSKAKWANIMVLKKVIIIMHGEDGRPTIVVNFDVLDRNTLKDL